MNILFVDLENVCRSPLAEALLKKKLEEHQIEGKIDSAGFESFYINEPPDKRVIEVAEKKGYTVSGNARIFVKKDFKNFDKIYVMDTTSYTKVMDLSKTKEDRTKVDYVMNVTQGNQKNISIPNPFYSGTSNCETIFDLLDVATDKIFEQILKS